MIQYIRGRLSLAGTLVALTACGGIEAGLSTSTGSSSAALGKDPAGRVSVVAAASAALPLSEPVSDEEGTPPLPNCDKLQADYQYAFTQIQGLVTWHALWSVPAYQAAGKASNAANKQNCSPSLLDKQKDCSELVGAFNEAFDSLRSTAQYQALDATEEWHALLVAYRNLKTQSCIE